MNTIYLSFDGVSDDVYLQARDRKMFDVKINVIENCKKLKEETGRSPSIVLVPTLVRGVNDHQVGEITKFAFDHSEVVRGVNFQPVAFTGRISREEVSEGRITLTDLVKKFEEQTGFAKSEDWYTVPIVTPISDFATELMGKNMVAFTTHPHCGLATYLFEADDGSVTPLPRFLDVKAFTDGLSEIADKMAKSKYKKLKALSIIKLLNKTVLEENMPAGLTKKKFAKVIRSIMGSNSKKTLADFSWKMMYVGGMHFQDSYNYDVERTQRCAIHYITPDLKIIPFCAYNGGPEYRESVEAQFSVPLAEWKERNKKAAKELEEALIVPEDQRA